MRSQADMYPTLTTGPSPGENTAALSRAAASLKPRSFEVAFRKTWGFQAPKGTQITWRVALVSAV
jgi:hypothetical protein